MHRVVATARWLYDQVAPTTVRIVETDYDFWYEIAKADGDVEIGERPQLGPAGRRYYPVYDTQVIDDGGTFWPDGPGFVSLDEAKIAVAERVPGTITWA